MTSIRLPGRAVVGVVLAASLVGAGFTALADTATTGCPPTYTDPAGDSGALDPETNAATGDDDLDIVAVTHTVDAGVFTSTVKVVALNPTGPNAAFGDRFVSSFTVAKKVVDVNFERDFSDLGTKKASVKVAGVTATFPVKLVEDVKTNTIGASMLAADLEKAVASPLSGQPFTAMSAVARAIYPTNAVPSVGALYDDATAPATATYAFGTSCRGGTAAAPSASSGSGDSGTAGDCPDSPAKVSVNTKVINATARASVTVTGATPTATIQLQGYSQNHRGTATFANDRTPVDRTGTADQNGSVTFNDLRPASNTRLRAKQEGCEFGGSAVIEVRATETLAVTRTGPRAYTFSGDSIPAREGGLIISLYRIVGSACAAGVEPASCPGEKLLGQARASATTGKYSIPVRFGSADAGVRDEFVVKTGRDAQNAPGRSNVRSLLIT